MAHGEANDFVMFIAHQNCEFNGLISFEKSCIVRSEPLVLVEVEKTFDWKFLRCCLKFESVSQFLVVCWKEIVLSQCGRIPTAKIHLIDILQGIV